ncbi:MAG: hypothetical protein K6B46_00620 [Opitutales bacterium]|nr:hypothetical protein [Opitutales bacterium]
MNFHKLIIKRVPDDCDKIPHSPLTGRKRAGKRDKPGFVASWVYSIARTTGWTIEEIMRTPAAQLLQLQHAELYFNGIRTKWVKTPAEVIDRVRRLREQKKTG